MAHDAIMTSQMVLPNNDKAIQLDIAEDRVY